MVNLKYLKRRETSEMLKVYENIKARRLELGLSQAKLAEMVGYADKSAISHMEKGEWDIPQSKLEAIAKALNMKPGELMGDTEYSIEDDLIALLKQLNQEGKEKVVEYARDLVAAGRYAKQRDKAEVV